MDEQDKRDLFEQQCKEHENAAAQQYEISVVGFGHALLAAVMRAKLMQYDRNREIQERDRYGRGKQD